MRHQPDLFSSEIEDIDQKTSDDSATVLKLTPQNDQLSPSQQRFNRLLEH